MPIQRIVLVGHCGFDSGSLTRFAAASVPDAEIHGVNDQAALDRVADADSLLLVNRVLDGRFDVGGSGIDLIRAYAGGENAPKLMLVSNYADAQQQAEDAGALPGFGKSQVGDPAVQERVTALVSGQAVPNQS